MVNDHYYEVIALINVPDEGPLWVGHLATSLSSKLNSYAYGGGKLKLKKLKTLSDTPQKLPRTTNLGRAQVLLAQMTR